MITFGITGSIACGKSTVTKFIRDLGIPVIDADVIAREVVVPGSPGLQAVINSFGKEFLTEDGELDRPKLGRLVFSNQSKLDILNDILHPIIDATSEKKIAAAHLWYDIVGYDSVLIIEQGNAKKYQPLIVVSAPFETQLIRLMSRNNLTEEEARDRISKQLSSKEKEKHAQFIIETTGTLDELKSKTVSIIDSIKKDLSK